MGPNRVHKPPVRLGGKLGYLEARRNEVARATDFAIKPTRVSGFYEIEFVGTATGQEIAVDVVFPCWFADRPAFSFGGELLRDIIEDGSFPTISAVVVKWTKVHDLRPGGGYFTGATLAIVATGRAGDKMVVHWQMDGRALSFADVSG